eukprot:scaffold7755_cov166-Amphora_coffeaeformis.AAC.1
MALKPVVLRGSATMESSSGRFSGLSTSVPSTLLKIHLVFKVEKRVSGADIDEVAIAAMDKLIVTRTQSSQKMAEQRIVEGMQNFPFLCMSLTIIFFDLRHR